MTNHPRGSDDTHFAPSGRIQGDAFGQQAAQCLESPMIQAVLASLGGMVAILNRQRQILAANAPLLEALQARQAGKIDGRRWGEIMGCIHAAQGPDGCGTSKACSCCGAALALLTSQVTDGSAQTQCRMAMRHRGAWEAREYRVEASMVDFDCGRLQVVVFQDVSDSQRKSELERIFLHDLANTVLALGGWTSVLERSPDPGSVARKILSLSQRLSDFVSEQRLVQSAEAGQWPLQPRDLVAGEVLDSVAQVLRAHPACRGHQIQVSNPVFQPLRSDPTILFRVLLNMGVNALEAEPPETAIHLGVRPIPAGTRFEVWNPSSMPEAVALQIFHRTFSTKASSGRGWGTYAMKLLGENLLGGTVEFTSTPEDGTSFHLDLPLAP